MQWHLLALLLLRNMFPHTAAAVVDWHACTCRCYCRCHYSVPLLIESEGVVGVVVLPHPLLVLELTCSARGLPDLCVLWATAVGVRCLRLQKYGSNMAQHNNRQ